MLLTADKNYFKKLSWFK